MHKYALRWPLFFIFTYIYAQADAQSTYQSLRRQELVRWSQRDDADQPTQLEMEVEFAELRDESLSSVESGLVNARIGVGIFTFALSAACLVALARNSHLYRQAGRYAEI